MSIVPKIDLYFLIVSPVVRIMITKAMLIGTGETDVRERVSELVMWLTIVVLPE